jgi:hypothetical protein
MNKFDKRGSIIPWKAGLAQDSNQPISSTRMHRCPDAGGLGDVRFGRRVKQARRMNLR